MINAGDSQVILKWSKNHPENHYLKIVILLVALAVASTADSLNDLKIQLIYIQISAYLQMLPSPTAKPIEVRRNSI